MLKLFKNAGNGNTERNRLAAANTAHTTHTCVRCAQTCSIYARRMELKLLPLLNGGDSMSGAVCRCVRNVAVPPTCTHTPLTAPMCRDADSYVCSFRYVATTTTNTISSATGSSRANVFVRGPVHTFVLVK